MLLSSSMFYHLRDREMLRKRKAEAKEKDSIQWALGDYEKSKRQKKSQGARRGRKRGHVMKPAPQQRPQSLKTEEDETMSSVITQQAESSQIDAQDLFSGVQLADLEGILASESQSPLGEEDMLKLADELEDVLSSSLENNGSEIDTNSSSPF
ncbi:hemogen isoform X2 [Coturnix japonica]|uniref:hemogen isoform X2 n=1 Tax=Coturnix japonica TaxID=93934 RepID=UPI0007773440|nr:hemogen isoform X2 [Coturnix japonica]